jgi:hypothetical protein
VFTDLKSLQFGLDTMMESVVFIARQVMSEIERENQQTMMGSTVTLMAKNSDLDDWISFPKFQRAAGSTGRSFFSFDCGLASCDYDRGSTWVADP